MKYLIVGLGNIGPEYQDTRHNIGFSVLDAFAKASNAIFEDKRYGAVCEVKIKGRTLILLKPNTYMNLSGKGFIDNCGRLGFALWYSSIAWTRE